MIRYLIALCVVLAYPAGFLLAGSPATGPSPGQGKSGEAARNRVLTLDGQTGFVQVPDSESLHSLKDAITIEAWVKAAAFHSRDWWVNCIVRKNIAPDSENFLLRFRTVDGEPLAEMSLGRRVGFLQGFHDFTTGTWYHLAGTYDGKVTTVYVNGVKVKSDRLSARCAPTSLTFSSARATRNSAPANTSTAPLTKSASGISRVHRRRSKLP